MSDDTERPRRLHPTGGYRSGQPRIRGLKRKTRIHIRRTEAIVAEGHRRGAPLRDVLVMMRMWGIPQHYLTVRKTPVTQDGGDSA